MTSAQFLDFLKQVDLHFLASTFLASYNVVVTLKQRLSKGWQVHKCKACKQTHFCMEDAGSILTLVRLILNKFVSLMIYDTCYFLVCIKNLSLGILGKVIGMN